MSNTKQSNGCCPSCRNTGEAPVQIDASGAEFSVNFTITPIEPIVSNFSQHVAQLEWLSPVPVPDGFAATFSAIVTTGPNPLLPYTEEGQFMYLVEKSFIQDTQPAAILQSESSAEVGPGGCVYVSVTAMDDTTHPVAALAAFPGDSLNDTVIMTPTDYVDLDPRTFTGRLNVTDSSDNVVVVTVLDELGNEANTTIELRAVDSCR